MMMMKVESASKLSNTTYHKRCRARGQKFWWLRDAEGNFLDIPQVRGDAYFEAELELAPGTYILGTGPKDYGVREKIVVE